MEQPNPSPPPSLDSDLARLETALAELQARVAALERGAQPIRRAQLRLIIRQLTESRFGLTVVNRIGAVTLAIGIIFFFKYAADNQWIGAGGLVILGLLVGVALIAAGERLRRRADQAFAQGLAGCGFAILYISVYAAFGYYKLIPRELGFAGLVAVSAAAIALCFRFLSPAIAAVGFIGAFIAPLLARGHLDGTPLWLYFVYVCLLGVVSVETVRRLRPASKQDPILFLAPFNAFWAVWTAHLLVGKHSPAEFVLLTIALAAIHFVAAFRCREDPNLFAYLYLCAHGCVLIAAFRAIHIWSASGSLESALDSILLGVYGVVVIIAGLLRRSAINRWLGLVLLGMVVVKLYGYDVWLLARFYRIGAFIALGVLLLAASYLYSRFKSATKEP